MKFALLLITLVSMNAFGVSQGLLFHKQSLAMQKSHGATELKAEIFKQKLNHKASLDMRTFKQRYFVDSSFAKGAKAPVFYIICGEWNCGGAKSYSYAVELARTYKGHLIALEHRYYGESLPFTKLTTKNLKFLTLENAIEDLARFQEHMMKKKGLGGKWIAVGGSYAGTLAAFYRLAYPKLVTGSLASSAPVFAKAEFKEYDAHVAKVINASGMCGDKVREAVAQIEARLKTKAGEAEVKEIFQAADVAVKEDFLYVVADMLAAAVQYGMDKQFCETLLSSKDLVSAYAKAGIAALEKLGATPSEISLQVAAKVDVTADDFLRQWMWQSCREFGWFQVANGKGKFTSRSSQIDLLYHANVCKRLYQTEMTADGKINDSWYFPLLDPDMSRIIFTNGSNDPWLNLSLTADTLHAPEGLDLLMMDGAAHCNDLSVKGTNANVALAQKEMTTIIGAWLK